MTKLFQKVLSILCVIALLVSGIAMAFADEANEAPVADEDVQQYAGDEVTQAADDEAEAARIAAEKEAALKAAEEEAARKAAEEEAARKAAEEEAARKAAEEEAARKAAEEEAARKAAEEEAARKAAEEEAARKAAEEAEAARIAAEQEAARKAAEEAEAAKKAEEAFEDETDENGYVEIDDSWGYVDPDVINENTPEITDEFKGILNATMNVNEMLSDTLSFGDELVITLKCGKASTVDLKLYTSGSDVNVKINGKAVAFTPADSDDPAYALSTFVLENAAGRTFEISLTTNDAASFTLAAVAEQTEVQDVTPGTKENAPAEENKEEPAPSEDNNAENTENTENNSENAETPANDVNVQSIENNSDHNNEATVEPIVPTEPAEPTIQVSVKTYSALKVGNSISDNLLGGQKAKFQVKCGKNDNVKLVLNANPDDLTIKIDGTDAAFVQDAEGTYSIELNDVAFRKFTIILSAKQDLAFSLSAESAGAAAVEDEGEENEEDINEEDINMEETENTDETVAEETTEEVTEETAEGETAEEENNEKNEDNATEEIEAIEEEAEGTEEEAVEEIIDEEKEKMTALGYTKVVVTAEEGADLYAESSKESEVVGHLDAGTEVWVILDEDQTFGQIYSDDEEAAAQFISMEDAEIKADETENEEENQEALTEEQIAELGYIKGVVNAEAGIDVFGSTEESAEAIDHLESGTEIWYKEANVEGWFILFNAEKETADRFVRASDIIPKEHIITEQTTDIQTSWDGDTLTFGSTIHMQAITTDFEGRVYTLQWQHSYDGDNWSDIENETGDQMDIVLSADNFQNHWRVLVKVEEVMNEPLANIE